MAFIGNTNQTQAFTPAVDYFNGNGSTTAFTLSRPVASVAQIQVVVDNVPQNPSSAYTVSGNTITFTSAPLSGTNNIYVEYTSPITQVNALSQSPSVVGDLTTSGGHYAVGSFTSGYTDGTVVDYTSGLGRISVGASDGLAFYRGGVANTESMRIDSSGNVGIGTASPSTKLHVVGEITATQGVSGTPAFSAYPSSNQSISANTWTKVAFQTKEFDTATCYNASTYVFTPNVAGYYQVNAQTGCGSTAERIINIRKNGVAFRNGIDVQGWSSSVSTVIYLNGTTDYLEVYFWQGSAGTQTSFGNQADTFFQAFLARGA